MRREGLGRHRMESAWAGAALVGLGMVLSLGAVARSQVPAEESARQLKPAEGLEATLWAAEPLLANPTTIDIDSRGRLWVTEGLNYRYTLHRDQPYIDEADRIKILEDTDGDGRADKATVFADRIFPVPMGIAIEERWSLNGVYQGCKVYVGNSPDLLVLEDTNGDDRADKRYPLLTGFGGVDHDHGVHGMIWGPDGKLYFTQGDGGSKTRGGYQFEVEDRSGRKVANNQLASTLRVNRDGTQFEILADRQRNNYETCVSAFGNVFTSDNDDDGNRGSRVIWVMDGGRYGYRTPGSPRHWGEEVPGNVPKLVGTGNGSPSGIMIYEGDALPGPYRGALLEADAGTRQINHFPLQREGAAFRTKAGVFLGSDDPWFRPIDACAAPDGSVFVADWYDGGVGGHAFRDQTTGRIYRVAAKGARDKDVAFDFLFTAGRMAALRSPNVSTRDVARRQLLAQGQDAELPLRTVFHAEGTDADQRARILWILAALPDGETDVKLALKHADPRMRELAVRILGQDNRLNGEVTEAQKSEPSALAHLEELLPLAGDPDAGVRRELILALRHVPTERAGEALRKLAAGWDGQDRWYLEALGLALRGRESALVASLFDGTLYGPLDAEALGRNGAVALPPYFPVDRNEAYLAAGETLPPAHALSKTLGLLWMLHRPEGLELLGRLLPDLAAPELRQAADDVLGQVNDPAGAVTLAEVAAATDDPARRSGLLGMLARRLEGDWRAAAGDPKVARAIEVAYADPASRVAAVRLAAAARSEAYLGRITHLAEEPGAPDELRVAAVEAVAQARLPRAREVLLNLVGEARRERGGSPATEAAVRALARLGNTREALEGLMADDTVPLSLRREALRGISQQDGGAQALLDQARRDQLSEALRTEAAVVLRSLPDRGLREQAQEVFPIKTASGKPLPPLGELIRREGDVEKGRAVFFRTAADNPAHASLACGACHRVQGQGQWVGPDLSTIGTKYGREELLRSILNPSAAIGYNVKSLIVATTDGRTLTGLPVEESAARLVLKTADGQRIAIPTAEIEERAWSEVSLMPEGLAETMGEDDLVDLLAFLGTLRQPVSIVGEAQAVGPITEAPGAPGIDLKAAAAGDVRDPSGKPLPTRRVTADAEGRIDLAAIGAGNVKTVSYVHVPIVSPAAQKARLVLDGVEGVRAWLDGGELGLEGAADAGPRGVQVELPAGRASLWVRVPGGATGGLVVTLVADTPIEFASGAAGGDASSR